MDDERLPDKALNRILHFAGVRSAVADGLHGVCRRWRNAIMSHEDWKRECGREGIDHIDRPDGVAVDWGAHFMSYAESQHTQGKVMAAVMHGKNIFMTGSGGVGKCLGRDTPVLRYDGRFKMVQDVQVGDVLMGDDSTPRTVLSTTTGREEMFRVKLTKGGSFTCNKSHVLSLKMTYIPHVMERKPPRKSWCAVWFEVTRDTEDGTVDSIKGKSKAFSDKEAADVHLVAMLAKENVLNADDTIDIAVEYLLDREKVKKNVFGNLVAFHPGALTFGDVEEQAQAPPLKRARYSAAPGAIEPYALGLYLGDGFGGYISENGHRISAGISNPDHEIVNYLRDYLRGLGLELRKTVDPYSYLFSQPEDARTKGGNAFTNFLMENQLGGPGKRIPDVYKYGSVQERLQVLAGIIDTDGSLYNGGFNLTLKSERLMDDVVFVSRSLGFQVARLKDRVVDGLRTTMTYNGNAGEPLGSYKRISINGETSCIPTRVARKQAPARVPNKALDREGFTLESLGDGDYFGFTIDGNHRFIVGEDLVVTHNTVLIKVMADKLRAMGMRTCVVATTGMAATLIGGTTLHRWGGVGLAKEPARDLLRKMRRETRERWRQTDVLIIDEVSMLDPDTFEKFDEIARHLRSCHDELFGGIQIIASGDFLQLPPIKPDGQYRFVFQHPVWEKGIDTTFTFKHIYRTTDALFTEVLGRVRTADHTDEDVQILKTRLNASIPETEKLGILPTRMYSHRADVDGHNRTQLAALVGNPCTFEAKVRVQRVGAHHAAQNRYVLRTTRAENQAAQACPVAQKMQYKDGAQVMLVVNLDPDEGLVNGSRGVVTDAHHEPGVEVQFLNGEKRVIELFRWTHDDSRGDKGEAIKLTYDQMPLALAWAYTVHKSQGATLDAAIMDLGPRVFAAGMSYVSLSRVRSLKSLSLIALDASAIRADALVKSYYAYIERHGTHKGFSATVNRLVFPTTREMRSLVRALPAIKKRRDAAVAAAEQQSRERDAGGDTSTDGKAKDEPVSKRARTS